MYSCTLSLFSANWEWVVPRSGRFTLGKVTRYPMYRRLDGPRVRSRQVWKISPTPDFDHRTVQTVASRYADRAIPDQLPYCPCVYCLRIVKEGRIVRPQLSSGFRLHFLRMANIVSLNKTSFKLHTSICQRKDY